MPTWQDKSPGIAQPCETAVGLPALGQLAVEFPGERNPILETDPRADRGEYGIRSWQSADHREGRSGDRLEPGGHVRARPTVVRPGGAGPQSQARSVIERDGLVEPSAEFGLDHGRRLRVVGKCESRRTCLLVGWRHEV